MHIWWDCPKIASYWSKIRELILHSTDTKIKLTPACCLLRISNYPLGRYKQTLTKYLLNAAKSLIPKQWKMTKVASIRDWARTVNHISEMEETLVMSNKTADKFYKT